MCSLIQFEGLTDFVSIDLVLNLAPWQLSYVWVKLALLSDFVQHPAKHISLIDLLVAWLSHMPLQVDPELVCWWHVMDALRVSEDFPCFRGRGLMHHTLHISVWLLSATVDLLDLLAEDIIQHDLTNFDFELESCRINSILWLEYHMAHLFCQLTKSRVIRSNLWRECWEHNLVRRIGILLGLLHVHVWRHLRRHRVLLGFAFNHLTKSN